MRRALLLVLALAVSGRAAAQPAPEPMLKAGVTEKPGAQLPLDTVFERTDGARTPLRAYFDGKRPVLLVLAYARCTMLCSLVLRGVAKAAKAIERQPGRDYRLVLVSLDARETVDEAARKHTSLLAQLGRGDGPDVWPYLVGSREAIDAVADAIGFRYAWDARTEQYAHPAVIFAITPDGRVSHYLHGVEFDPTEVTAALDDAAAGRVVSNAVVAVLRCFHFDPAARRAGARAQLFLRIGAAFIFVFSFAGITLLILWERKLRRRR